MVTFLLCCQPQDHRDGYVTLAPCVCPMVLRCCTHNKSLYDQQHQQWRSPCLSSCSSTALPARWRVAAITKSQSASCHCTAPSDLYSTLVTAAMTSGKVSGLARDGRGCPLSRHKVPDPCPRLLVCSWKALVSFIDLNPKHAQAAQHVEASSSAEAVASESLGSGSASASKKRQTKGWHPR